MKGEVRGREGRGGEGKRGKGRRGEEGEEGEGGRGIVWNTQCRTVLAHNSHNGAYKNLIPYTYT